MNVPKILGLLIAFGLTLCALAHADDPKSFTKRLQSKSVSTVIPIFSQLLRTGYPQGFAPAFDKAKPQSYILEWVLAGETVHNWTQMITITGARGLGAKPNVTPGLFLNIISEQFKRTCPTSFGVKVLNTNKVSGFDAVTAVVSCGTSAATAGKTSESMLIVVIKGQADLYTVQWAERTSPSTSPIPIDTAKWLDRYEKLNPLKLCPIVHGEPPPYPSCVGSGEKEPT